MCEMTIEFVGEVPGVHNSMTLVTKEITNLGIPFCDNNYGDVGEITLFGLAAPELPQDLLEYLLQVGVSQSLRKVAIWETRESGWRDSPTPDILILQQ